MPEYSLSNIYRQNDGLKEQLPLWRFMKSKERIAFVEAVKALMVEAREFERSTESQSTKSQLQNIIQIWEDILSYIENTSVRVLTVLSTSRKTFPVSGINSGEKPSMKKSIAEEWVRIAHSVSQPLNPHKVDPNSPPPIPRDPELRAIYHKYYGIVDSKGDTE